MFKHRVAVEDTHPVLRHRQPQARTRISLQREGHSGQLSALLQPQAVSLWSRLPYKLRLQLHRADAIDLAVDVVIALDKANVLHLRAHLHDER